MSGPAIKLAMGGSGTVTPPNPQPEVSAETPDPVTEEKEQGSKRQRQIRRCLSAIRTQNKKG